MSQDTEVKDSANQRAYNLTIAAVVSQVGCLTLIVIILVLLGGLWLDVHFNTKPLFTILLIVASVPVTLFMMFWVVRRATSKMRIPDSKQENNNGKPAQEDLNRGTGTDE